MAQTVIGMFDNSSEAQQAVEKLVSSGISRDRIDVTDQSSSSSSSGSTGSSYSSTDSGSTTRDHDDDHHDNAITRFFKNLFGDDDDDADKYSKVASRAKSIVTVHAQTSDEAEDAADILDDNGAVDVNERASEYGYGSSSKTGSTGTLAGDAAAGAAGAIGAGAAALTGRDTDTDRTRSTATGTGDYTGTSDRTSNDENRKIPVIKEDIEVGKREVQSGGARVRSRIVERPVEESIRLRQERVNVERNPVDRPARDADFKNFEEKDIEMVERSEVPVVNKQARVVEEVSLNKQVEEKNETVRDTVKNTEVDVDNLDKDDVRNSSTGGSSTGSSSTGSGSSTGGGSSAGSGSAI